MRFAFFLGFAAIVLVTSTALAVNDPAQFWISTSATSPTIGETPLINLAYNPDQGRTKKLYLWARPATDANGNFRTLQDFSVDVATEDATSPYGAPSNPFIDFVDTTFHVYNNQVGVPTRFQYVADSVLDPLYGGPLLSTRSPLQITDPEFPQADSLKGLAGISFSPSSYAGIGNASDSNSVMTPGGRAWLVGEFGIQSLHDTGTNYLFLQIGAAGMQSQGNGDGGAAGQTNVIFGDNSSPIYNAACSSNTECLARRDITLAGDTFDLQITAVAFTPGDYDSDGFINANDYAYWASTFGSSVTAGDASDGNNNTRIDAADYAFWRKKSAAGSSAPTLESTNLVPEPGSLALASVLLGAFLSGIRRTRTVKSV